MSKKHLIDYTKEIDKKLYSLDFLFSERFEFSFKNENVAKYYKIKSKSQVHHNSQYNNFEFYKNISKIDYEK